MSNSVGPNGPVRGCVTSDGALAACRCFGIVCDMTQRIVGAAEPAYDRGRVFFNASPFAARWIAHPDAPGGAESEHLFVCRYDLAFEIPDDCTIRIHVSADERYVLRLDGERIGRGPERGELHAYHYETYDLHLKSGRHRLSAQVHSFGRRKPWAQVSIRHAFVLFAEGDLGKQLSTGVAAWMATRLNEYAASEKTLPHSPLVVGARCRIVARERHAPASAVAVIDIGPFVLASMRMESPSQWQLVPSPLPAMLDGRVRAGSTRQIEGATEANEWDALLHADQPLVVPPHSRVSVLIDLNDYHCVYPSLATDGGAGAKIDLDFAEAMFDSDRVNKVNRDRVDGLVFVGTGDTFICDGAPATFEPLWWSCGRYVRITIETGAQSLTLASLSFDETRYPFGWDSTITTGDEGIDSFLPITRRAMEMCSHETFVDCPYYEQLMYVGDSRLEALVTYTHSSDDRLPRKSVAMFDRSRTPDGWTQSRTPAWMKQVIPPFSWWWVGMVYDLALWRDRPNEVARCMPGVRAVMEAAYQQIDDDGLYQPTTGWNFVDWVPGWHAGAPPNESNGPLAPLHFHVAYTAGLAAQLEVIVGEPLLAERHSAYAARLNAAGRHRFYDPSLHLFADDGKHEHHSEHAQCLAFLSGAVNAHEREAFADALISPNQLARTTIYFTHYLFETFRELGRIDAMFDRLKLWTGLKAAGFKTTPESPEPSRSDCHAWGAHPMYHLYASVLGVRPSSAGFRTVEIAPRLGPLQSVRGSLVHPRGKIDIVAEQRPDGLHVDVTLPPGVTGVLKVNGRTTPLG